jgi:hypothetical protein
VARLYLASSQAFKDTNHLIHRLVLWPTHLDNPIKCTRVFQHLAGKQSHIIRRHKIDRIVAAPKDYGSALFENGQTHHLAPQIHECGWAKDGEIQTTGTQVFFDGVLDTEERYWTLGPSTPNGNKDEVFYASGFGCVDQMAIAKIIYGMRVIIALPIQGMGGC